MRRKYLLVSWLMGMESVMARKEWQLGLCVSLQKCALELFIPQ